VYYEDILLHLSLLRGIGPGMVERICSAIPADSINSIYAYSYNDFRALGLGEQTALSLVEGLKDYGVVEQERSLLEKHGIEWISFYHPAYPLLLKEIHLPPVGLYVRGELGNLEHCIALVGSRKANAYGQRVIEYLVPSLVKTGWTIVSGGALGADAMAHKATIKAGGKTIVVLGSGLLRPYPSMNIRLFDQVVQAGGALVSSFSLQTGPHAGNFPARNRIIAGLSRGCIVVQAAQESGASITARFALEQGREVFAVPGSIEDELSAGCHALLQQGATLITKADDVNQHMGVIVETDASVAEQLSVLKQVIVRDAPQEYPLTEEEHIVRYCDQPRSLDELMEMTSKDMMTLQTILADLHLQGRLEYTYAGLWQASSFFSKI
jgi:DNA processing protein